MGCSPMGVCTRVSAEKERPPAQAAVVVESDASVVVASVLSLLAEL